MSDEQTQAPLDGQAETGSSPEEPEQQNSQKVQIPEDMSYAEYLKLVNPDKSDAEIARMIRKENRYTWLGRFQILAFLVIIILIIALIVTNN